MAEHAHRACSAMTSLVRQALILFAALHKERLQTTVCSLLPLESALAPFPRTHAQLSDVLWRCSPCCSAEAHSDDRRISRSYGFYVRFRFSFRDCLASECPQYNLLSAQSHSRPCYCVLWIFESSFSIPNVGHLLATLFRVSAQSSIRYSITGPPRPLSGIRTLPSQKSLTE